MASVQSASAQRLPYRLPSPRAAMTAVVLPPQLRPGVAADPTRRSAAAEYVGPRDRVRRHRLAPGTPGRVGPWYDAGPGPAALPSGHGPAPPPAAQAAAARALDGDRLRGHGGDGARVLGRVRDPGLPARNPRLGRPGDRARRASRPVAPPPPPPPPLP